MIYISLLLGGAIGGALRYATMLLFGNGTDVLIPTLCINLGGCFILGLFSQASGRKRTYIWLRAGLLTGVVGSYTTYSTFCLQTQQLLLTHPDAALLYGLFSLTGGPTLIYAGNALSTYVAGKMGYASEEVTV